MVSCLVSASWCVINNQKLKNPSPFNFAEPLLQTKFSAFLKLYFFNYEYLIPVDMIFKIISLYISSKTKLCKTLYWWRWCFPPSIDSLLEQLLYFLNEYSTDSDRTKCVQFTCLEYLIYEEFLDYFTKKYKFGAERMNLHIDKQIKKTNYRL